MRNSKDLRNSVTWDWNTVGVVFCGQCHPTFEFGIMLSLYFLLIAISYTHSEETATTSANDTTLYQVPTKTFNNDTTLPAESPIIEPKNSPATWQIDPVSDKGFKPSTTSWKIETSYAEPTFSGEREDNTKSKEDVKKIQDLEEYKVEKQEITEFRPSQHLGSFFDEEKADVIKKPNFGPLKKPSSGFISSPKDEFHTTNRRPLKDIYKTHREFPYKFENPTKTKGNWHLGDSIDSKPTVEIPVKVPAGGFYQSPEGLRGSWSGEEYALLADEGFDYGVKKRPEPWRSLLQVMAAFIPAGLIISALTPNIVTIQNTGTSPQYPSNQFRRSDRGVANEAPISEDCRRRLLCELHSDYNYLSPSSSAARRKHCYKLHCEDTDALWRMLRWLLAHHRPTAGYRGRTYT